jgi:hypothetical protein
LTGLQRTPGNRNAINALISSHSVVFDLTARRAWVAQDPHGLGRFVAYSLDLGIAADPADPRFQALASEWLPADPWLTGGGYANYVASRRLLAQADLALTSKRPRLALAKAQEALRRVPGSVEALALSAEAARRNGRSRGGRQAVGSGARARSITTSLRPVVGRAPLGARGGPDALSAAGLSGQRDGLTEDYRLLLYRFAG